MPERRGSDDSVDLVDSRTQDGGIDRRNLLSEAPMKPPEQKGRDRNSFVFALAVIFVVLLCITVGAAGHKVFRDRYHPCPANNTADYEAFYDMVYEHFRGSGDE